MLTPTKGVDVGGHRLHQMLIVFPLGLLAGGLIFDIFHWFSADGRWGVIAFWLISIGIVAALLAAVFGFIDWLGIPSNTRAKVVGAYHGIGNVIVVTLFFISWLARLNHIEQPGGVAYAFSVAGVCLVLVTGWLGGELVSHFGVGVHPDVDLNARPTLSNPSSSSTARPAVHTT
jgi:uncharacterized membrane protein